MRRLSATMQIAVGLGCLSMTVLLVAQLLGLIPDSQAATLQGRKALCVATAINCSVLASRGDTDGMRICMEAMARRNHDILSVGIRRGGQCPA